MTQTAASIGSVDPPSVEDRLDALTPHGAQLGLALRVGRDEWRPGARVRPLHAAGAALGPHRGTGNDPDRWNLPRAAATPRQVRLLQNRVAGPRAGPGLPGAGLCALSPGGAPARVPTATAFPGTGA